MLFAFCIAESFCPQHAKVWAFKRNWRPALHLKHWAACYDSSSSLAAFAFRRNNLHNIIINMSVHRHSTSTCLFLGMQAFSPRFWVGFPLLCQPYLWEEMHLRYIMSQWDTATKRKRLSEEEICSKEICEIGCLIREKRIRMNTCKRIHVITKCI